MNKLFYGDNLEVLRGEIADESVDLIYLDPPFNSNANYNILFKSKPGDGADAQIEAFEDSWHWNDKAEDAFDQVMRSGLTGASELLRAMRGFLGENDMMAYLAMMAIRLIELHRVLKPTGSLYSTAIRRRRIISSCCWMGCSEKKITSMRSYGNGQTRITILVKGRRILAASTM